MIPLKFKIALNERLYKSEKWISNGHWLLPVSELNRSVENGRYENGINKPKTDNEPPNMDLIVPSELGERLEITERAIVKDCAIRGVILETESKKEVGIAPEYFALLQKADEIRYNNSINLIKDGKFFGCVMPVRIS